MTVKKLSALDEYMNSIRNKRARLQKMKDEFLKAAQSEPDQFRRLTSKTFARYAEIMEDLFMNLEMLAIVDSGLKSQNEMLKDIILELQEVKTDPRMISKIDKAFREYNEILKKQYDEFFKSQSE